MFNLKNILIAILAGGAIAFTPGCSIFGEPAGQYIEDPSLPPQVNEVKKLVFESRILLLAVAKTYNQQFADGIINEAERKQKGELLAAYAKDLDKVDELLGTGDVLSAENKAKAVNAIVKALHKAVVKELR